MDHFQVPEAPHVTVPWTINCVPFRLPILYECPISTFSISRTIALRHSFVLLKSERTNSLGIRLLCLDGKYEDNTLLSIESKAMFLRSKEYVEFRPLVSQNTTPHLCVPSQRCLCNCCTICRAPTVSKFELEDADHDSDILVSG